MFEYKTILIGNRSPTPYHIDLYGGYRGPKMEAWVVQRFLIVLQAILRTDDTNGFKLLPRRKVVERTFSWL